MAGCAQPCERTALRGRVREGACRRGRDHRPAAARGLLRRAVRRRAGLVVHRRRQPPRSRPPGALAAGDAPLARRLRRHRAARGRPRGRRRRAGDRHRPGQLRLRARSRSGWSTSRAARSSSTSGASCSGRSAAAARRSPPSSPTRTREVMEILREDCGIEAWMAFGTLLGAARAGKAIGHDSDSDLLYLSEKATPAEINLEAYAIQRAFTRRGLTATLKSGSFVTVLFPGPDGAPLGIDVYACFYVDGVLHETATLREPIPREAILPLTTLSYEGLELPGARRPGPAAGGVVRPGLAGARPVLPPRARQRHGGPLRGLVRQHDDRPPRLGGVVARAPGDRTGLGARRAGDGRPPGAGERARDRCRQRHRRGPDGRARPSRQRLRLRPALLRRGQPGHARGRPARPVRPLQPLRPARHDDARRPAAAPAAAAARRPRPVRARARSTRAGIEAFWRLVATCLRDGGRAYLEFSDEDDPDRDNPQRLYPLRFEVEPDDVRRRLERRSARGSSTRTV